MGYRREFLRSGCTAALAASLAGCSGTSGAETRIGEIVLDNKQNRANTFHLLVLCDGEVVLWRTFDFEARPDLQEDPPKGTVVDDIPAEWTDCRVHARLNDEETAEIDLANYDVECTIIDVEAHETAGFYLTYSTDPSLCE